MGDKKKNQAMVNAFGTGKPPVATVRKQGETKQQQRARGQGVDPNSDISAIFGGMQQMRTRVHKGLSGMPLNPDGTDPGNSFDRFMRQNPHLQGAAQRQAQYDQQRQEQFQRKYPNASGYPALFPEKSSPPGGGQGDRVGSSNPSGEPGGETLFGQMPNVQGEGMPMGMPKARTVRQPGIQYGPRQPVQQTGWDALFPGKQVNSQMGPNAGLQALMAPNEGPQLPYSSPNQIEALRKLNTRGTLPGRQPETGTGFPTAPSRFRFDMTNYFPGNDFNYLQTLFPGMSIDQILQLVENPAYANQLR